MSKPTDADIAYTLVNIYLDGKGIGWENDDCNPILREVCLKITALKLAVKGACKLGNFDEEELAPRLMREALKRVREAWERQQK